MNSDTKSYVVNLLETYQERKRKIAMLHYELEHPAHTSEAEMISAMTLSKRIGQRMHPAVDLFLWSHSTGSCCSG